jgi:hypothetical protein
MDLGIEQCFLVVLFPMGQVKLIQFGTRVPPINDRVAMSTVCLGCELIYYSTEVTELVLAWLMLTQPSLRRLPQASFCSVLF